MAADCHRGRVSRLVLLGDYLGNAVSFEGTIIVEQVVRKQILQGQFASTFPDLALAAAGREDLDLRILAPQIYADAAKGDEAFEAFGMKFPSDQITRWGLVVLICVQLYLFLYLKQLYNKLQPDDPGWDAPWIVMDQSLLARAIVFLSVVVLPIIAADVVMAQAYKQYAVQHGDRAGLRMLWTPKADLIYLGFAVSVALSFLSWEYRPRLVEPRAPLQLFE